MMQSSLGPKAERKNLKELKRQIRIFIRTRNLFFFNRKNGFKYQEET